MRIVHPEHPSLELRDGEVGELQVRGPMIFSHYYKNTQATEEAKLPNGWFRTGDAAIIQNGSLRLNGRLKDTLIINGVSYGLSEIEDILQNLHGVVSSSCVVAPWRTPGAQTETYVVFFSPNPDPEITSTRGALNETINALRGCCIKMISLAPHLIIPINVSKMERSSLGKLSRFKLLKLLQDGAFQKNIDQSQGLSLTSHIESEYPRNGTEKCLATIYARVLHLQKHTASRSDNFFELGGTSVHIIQSV